MFMTGEVMSQIIESILEFDLLQTVIMMAVTALLVIAYAVRVALKGRARYDRVDRQGGSIFMSKGLMEMGYWGLQPVARLCIFLHITPNMLTWVSLAFGLAAGVCLGVGHFGSGAVFGALSALLDALDGMVARLTGQGSQAGVVFDSAVDRYTEFFFVAGLVVYYRHIPVVQILALLTFLGAFMVAYSTAKSEAMQVTLPAKSPMRRPERALYLILGAALCPVTIPIFEVYRAYGKPIGHPMVLALCLVGVLANFAAVERLQIIARTAKSREQDQADKTRRDAVHSLRQSDELDSKQVSHSLRHP